VGQILQVDGLADILGCKVSHLQLKYLAQPLGACKAQTVWDGIL